MRAITGGNIAHLTGAATPARNSWFRWPRHFLAAAAGAVALLLTAVPLAAQSPAQAALCADSLGPAPELPILVLESENAGPTVAYVAGVHGGKAAAVVGAGQLAEQLEGQLRRGRVLIVAPANVEGYRARLAQLSPMDSLNLNRVFPGDPCGQPTERLADRILREVVQQSDFVVDMHGSDGFESVARFAYAARPGLDPAVDSAARRLAEWWGVPVIVWDRDGPRSLSESRFLQTAAHLSGVPAITVFEAGRLSEDLVASAAFAQGARRVLVALGMLAPTTPDDSSAVRPAVPDVFPRRAVISADVDGTWVPLQSAGASVSAGELLGRLRDSSGVSVPVRASAGGPVLHLRIAGTISAGTPLAIIGALPDTPRSF